jgi:hypothetical protein
MKLKCLIAVILLSVPSCFNNKKLNLFMFWEDTQTTFGTKYGFLPAFLILPLNDSNSVNCSDLTIDSCFWGMLPNDTNICPDSLNGKSLTIIDTNSRPFRTVTYYCGDRRTDTLIHRDKPFLLSEGIKKILNEIKKKHPDSFMYDTVILAINNSTSNKALLFCIKELQKNGFKAIFVCFYKKSSNTVWSAYDNVDMKMLKTFRSKDYHNLREVSDNISTIRNSLLLLKFQ